MYLLKKMAKQFISLQTKGKTFYINEDYSLMDKVEKQKCILCGKELNSACEQLFGVCKEDAPKVKRILGMAMSIGGFGGN